jgi:hypothetical protein
MIISTLVKGMTLVAPATLQIHVKIVPAVCNAAMHKEILI